MHSFYASGRGEVSSFLTRFVTKNYAVFTASVEIFHEPSTGVTGHHKDVPITFTQVGNELKKTIIMIHHSGDVLFMNNI